jgi:predicted nucleotidyltransferase
MRSLDEASLSDRDRAAVRAAAAALRAALPVEQIVLFGSAARGERGPESDLDLLIVTTRPLTPEESRRIVPVLYPIQIEAGVVLSTIEVTHEEWEHGAYKVLPIRRQIERDGVAA